MNTSQEMNAVLGCLGGARFGAPARATVEAKLAAPQYTVEIAVIAANESAAIIPAPRKSRSGA